MSQLERGFASGQHAMTMQNRPFLSYASLSEKILASRVPLDEDAEEERRKERGYQHSARKQTRLELRFGKRDL